MSFLCHLSPVSSSVHPLLLRLCYRSPKKVSIASYILKIIVVNPMKKQGRHEESSNRSPTDRLPRNPLSFGVGRTLTVIVLASQVSRTMAFSVIPYTGRAPSLMQATRAADLVQPVQPKRYTPPSKRQEAVKAMDRQQMAENSVDAKMLELLSDQFLYPSPPVKRERPRGRPESVPGAMGYEATLRFRQENEGYASTIAPYAAPPAMSPATSQAPKRKKTHIRGSAKEGDSTLQRKKVVKNLPEPRNRPQDEQQQQQSQKRRRWNDKSVDLQKYYRTELLTAKEEYSLGMKIHFMMQCEEVHEGLAARLGRLPTMEEWALACGFTDPDPMFVEKEGDCQIRPVGAASLFLIQDPQMFVGNGLATEAGPGRGRGRVKKPPCMELGPYYDDSELKFPDVPPRPISIKGGIRVNVGTVTDFVETMLTGREAKQRMVQSNMRLVVSIARKYSNVGVNLQDLVQEGSLGLSRAAEKFEPQKGFKFSTYASWWIQQAVFRSIAYHSRTIRLPVHVHNLLNRIRRVRMSLERDLGRTPTNDEMAEQLDMTTGAYNKMIRLTRRSISLELPKYQQNPKDLGHESEDLLGDTISASSVPDESSPEKRVDRGLFHEDLCEMLNVLEEDERRVISARYGLADGLTRTVTAVAAQMKQSKAWVRSQECRALRKLRRPWYEQRLKQHQDALTN